MIALPARSHSAAQLVTVMVCVSCFCFTASCNSTSRDPVTMSTSGSPARSSAPRFVPHEVLVKFKDGISQAQVTSVLKSNQMEIITEIQKGRLYHVRILDDRSVESAVKQITSYREVEYAEPNYRYETQQ